MNRTNEKRKRRAAPMLAAAALAAAVLAGCALQRASSPETVPEYVFT